MVARRGRQHHSLSRLRAVAVAQSCNQRTLGVDAEIDDALLPETVGIVLVAEEIAWIERVSDQRRRPVFPGGLR
jgi:hypothetical protein